MRFAFVVSVCALFLSSSSVRAQQPKSPLEKLEDKLQKQKQQGKLPPPPTRVVPGYIGIDGVDGQPGVSIVEVKKGGPASVAGVRIGDTILSIGNTKVRNLDHLGQILAKTRPDQTISLTVRRGRANVLVQVKLGQKPAPPGVPEAVPPIVRPKQPQAEVVTPPSANQGKSVAAARKPLLGIRAIPIDSTLRIRLGLPVREGAIITGIYPNTPASRNGLPIGGVIIAISGNKITSPDDIIRLLRKSKIGDTIEVTYYNRGQLSRKKIPLTAVSAPASTPPLLSPPLAGGVGNPRVVQRPLLNKLEGIIDRINNSPPRSNSVNETARLRGRVTDLEKEVADLRKRLQQLEALLKKKP